MYKKKIMVVMLAFSILAEVMAADSGDCLKDYAPARECLQSMLAEERDRMNQALEELADRIESFRRPALRTMQAKWRAYRDAKCGFFVHPHAGTGGVLDALQCEVDETRRRTKELRKLH